MAIAQSGGRAPRPMAEKGLMPLAQILKIARRRVPGQVIEVELDDGDDDDEPEYELEILTPDGRSIEMKIDARRGTILDVEED
ncbi:MAG: PepSY domain-containing protein [Sphingobium sp.]